MMGKGPHSGQNDPSILVGSWQSVYTSHLTLAIPQECRCSLYIYLYVILFSLFYFFFLSVTAVIL